MTDFHSIKCRLKQYKWPLNALRGWSCDLVCQNKFMLCLYSHLPLWMRMGLKHISVHTGLWWTWHINKPVVYTQRMPTAFLQSPFTRLPMHMYTLSWIIVNRHTLKQQQYKCTPNYNRLINRSMSLRVLYKHINWIHVYQQRLFIHIWYIRYINDLGPPKTNL